MTWKNSKSRENLYCVSSEIVNFAYGFFLYFLILSMVELLKESFLSCYTETPKFWGYVLYECPSVKYVPSKLWSFIHPVPQFSWIPFWWPLSQQYAYAFFYSPIPKRTLRKFLFCFLSKKKSFVDIPLFWQSRRSWQDKKAVCEAQCLGLNIFLSTCCDNLFYHGSS